MTTEEINDLVRFAETLKKKCVGAALTLEKIGKRAAAKDAKNAAVNALATERHLASLLAKSLKGKP